MQSLRLLKIMSQTWKKLTNVLHPWHGVCMANWHHELLMPVIEIPQGSRAKYEIDKPSGLLKLDRVIYSSFYYPSNYGFIPQTYGDDKDPLDILVISSLSIVPMCLVTAKLLVLCK